MIKDIGNVYEILDLSGPYTLTGLRTALRQEGFRCSQSSEDNMVRIHYAGDILDGDHYKIGEITGTRVLVFNDPRDHSERLIGLLKRVYSD